MTILSDRASVGVVSSIRATMEGMTFGVGFAGYDLHFLKSAPRWASIIVRHRT